MSSRPWSEAPRNYAAALGLVAGAMFVRVALNPILGSNLPFFLQFLAVLVAARFWGFLPAVAGLALGTLLPVYRAVSDDVRPQYGLALIVVWPVCVVLIWLIDRHQRINAVVKDTTRLADERLQELGQERGRREREERFAAQLRAIVESSEDAIVSKSLDGIIQSWNHAAEALYGYSAEEAVGKPISLVVPPDRRHEEGTIIERMREGTPLKHFETVRVRKDGKQVAVSLTVSPILDARGKIVGVSHIARDISNRKEMEEQMRQTQKLESLGVLAGGLAHDFNNLLTGVLGNASLLQEDLDPAQPAHARIQEIVQAAERAAVLVKQMLAYAGKGRFVIQRLDLSRQIAEIVPLIRSSLAPGVQLELQLGPGLPPVEADPSQMQQLVMNLAINAAEAVGQGPGSVTISTSTREAAGDLHAVLTVADTGCGMDEATKARIFDPFFTTKFTGRGLGLAAVLGIIRAHRGSISVESHPGNGSTFTVVLPPAEGVELDVREPLAELLGHGAILVVDDEELVRNMARFSLQRYGYTVETAPDGRSAVEIFGARPQDFDAVLVDLTMPMNGEDAMRAVRRIHATVPILVSTGFSEAEAVKRFADQGIAGFIQKPYTAATLARKLKQAMRQAAAQRSQ